MRKTETQINPDWLTITVYFLLVVTGWMVLYSVDSEVQASSLLQLNYVKQLFWIVGALILGGIVIYYIKPYHIYVSIQFFYVFMLLVVLLVAFTGQTINGARSWIRIGGFSIQPAEFLKFATALIFAKVLAVRKKYVYSLWTVFLVFLPVVIAALAVLVQGDMGSALVFGAFLIPAYREKLLPGSVLIYILLMGILFFLSLIANKLVLFLVIYLLTMIFLVAYYPYFFKQIVVIFLSVLASLHFINVASGVRVSYLLTVVLSFLLAFMFFLVVFYTKIKQIRSLILVFVFSSVLFVLTYFTPFLYSKLEPHQKARIEYYIHPEKIRENFSTKDVSYNIRQAILAISAGGLKGRGYLKGTHNKLRFVPEQDKDYIFCTVAEELGFWGSVLSFALFMFLFVQIFRIAERHKSVFVRAYGYSVLGILFFHFAINLGSTITMLPVIGIPLPFYSYGGSAMLNFSLMLATLLNFDRYRNISFEDVYS